MIIALMATDLPEPIQALATLHAVVIIGEDLATDIDNLLKSIERGQRRTANHDPSEKTAAQNPDDEDNS